MNKKIIEEKIDEDIQKINDELVLKCPENHSPHHMGFFMVLIVKFLLRKIYDLNSTKE